MTNKGRWYEKFSVGDRVSVRTYLNGKEQWAEGTVTQIPARVTWDPKRIRGEFVVKSLGLGSEIRVIRAGGVRPAPQDPRLAVVLRVCCSLREHGSESHTQDCHFRVAETPGWPPNYFHGTPNC